MTKFFGYTSFFFIVGILFFNDFFSALSLTIWGYFLLRIILNSTKAFVFREWALFLYAQNYLLSPLITYQLDESLVAYPMKIGSGDYFPIAISGMISLIIGVYFFKTRIFTPDIIKLRIDSEKNESLLIRFLIVGLIGRLIGDFIPSYLAFFLYLLSSIRFLAAFALFSFNQRRNWIWVVSVLFLEFLFAVKAAMFHDAFMWTLFFGLFYAYIIKPSLAYRVIAVALAVLSVFFIQRVKESYRNEVWQKGQESSLSLYLQTSSNIENSFVSDENLSGTLNRANQSWIFASTMERMDRVHDFQGLIVLGIYLESALLPRFLSPNKIEAGDKKIFNQFSGHYINSGTSMGLGVFADGYVAYGYWGVMLFTLGLGLLFSLTFYFLESWARISEFYVLLVLPLMNYMVRPDCELQTTINHLVKGLVLFGVLVTMTKYTFIVSSRKFYASKR